MKNVKLLDCTLRDGGRIIDCAFRDFEISQITAKLSQAGIDIIELGFLRDYKDVKYSGNSTFFTDIDQLTPFIPTEHNNAEYVAFIDYGMFDFSTLKVRSEHTIGGLRLGFTKDDFENHYDDLVAIFRTVKTLKYNLYIQGVNSLNYSDIELLKIVDMVNSVKPVSFGIVDTYGAMYVDDVSRVYGLIDHNLDQDIAIDFHSHNNFQLSFSFAQEIIRLSNGVRNIIIDATLCGMGKEAGNLNTELIADFLARKMNCNYSTDILFDTIDDHIYDLHEKFRWGYTPNTLISGIYRSHPNNVIYLVQKFRLDTKDIKNILAMLDEKDRQRYDYDKLDKLIETYNDSKYDDSRETNELSNIMRDKPVLVLVPGKTISTNREIIDRYIEEVTPIIISVNFITDYSESFAFFANKKRYGIQNISGKAKKIVTSNVAQNAPDSITVNYYSVISHGYKLFDNSVFMLLNLLKRLCITNITIAGMDGFDSNTDSNYFDASFDVDRLIPQFDEINRELALMLKNYIEETKSVSSLSLITPSLFSYIFE